jgi:hypothetical protein
LSEVGHKCRRYSKAWDIIYTQRAPIAKKKLMDVSLQALAMHEQGLSKNYSINQEKY